MSARNFVFRKKRIVQNTRNRIETQKRKLQIIDFRELGSFVVSCVLNLCVGTPVLRLPKTSSVSRSPK